MKDNIRFWFGFASKLTDRKAKSGDVKNIPSIHSPNQLVLCMVAGELEPILASWASLVGQSITGHQQIFRNGKHPRFEYCSGPASLGFKKDVYSHRKIQNWPKKGWEYKDLRGQQLFRNVYTIYASFKPAHTTTHHSLKGNLALK